MAAPRNAQTRKADTLAKLNARGDDVWVASASMDCTQPQAHLIPLSLSWIDDCVDAAPGHDHRFARRDHLYDARRDRAGHERIRSCP
jgi:hypothetical protein